MTKIVLFEFAGRRENMEVQLPYLHRLLDLYPEMEVHLWDLTRTPEDRSYLMQHVGAHGGRIQVIGHLHPSHPIRCIKPPGRPRRGWPRCTCMKCKPPYEKPYRWYANNPLYNDSDVFVKIDDDVLFLETENFDHLIDPLRHNPDRIISANVVNNVVCAKHESVFAPMLANQFGAGDPKDVDNDRRWWELHTNPNFARVSHDSFLTNKYTLLGRAPSYVRTRPGEALSINCIAFTQATMKRLAPMMNDRLGDEGAVDRLLPWICQSFHAAHLSFGPQEQTMTSAMLDGFRDQYVTFRERYLAENFAEKTGEWIA